MADARVPSDRERRTPGAQFRCQVCARFVIATEYGVCPRCGLGPVTVPPLEGGPPDDAAWRDARRRAHQLGVGSGYWLTAVGVALAIAVGCALLVIY